MQSLQKKTNLSQKMSFPEVVDLSSDDEPGEVVVNAVKQEPGLNTSIVQHKRFREAEMNLVKQEPGLDPRIVQHRNNNLEAYASKLPPAPICRQFWKAGNYDDSQASKLQLQGGQNHLSVNPKFLHSNATSHKWAFGAIAELLDNAFDEVQNGASFVVVDKIINQRDGCPALLIHDDGGGMDPESMRRCMSFGFSAKKSTSAIGQYGNGFKTSTMRLGADVIVFSRHTSTRVSTQSVGLLSYSFLRQTGHDRIVVPMVDYEFEASTGKLRNIRSYSSEQFSANLSIIIQWSPYESEAELLKQFDNMGPHGTKVIIYNLWFNDGGDLELDFETDPEDILLTGAPKIVQSSRQGKMMSQYHIANRFSYSLRVYSSILYLRVPKHFRIILRGRVVDHHNIANDLKFPEFILYKPQIGGNTEAAVITTIGFLKDAPHVNIHGFSVYHKNRLIMPFWRVVSQTNSRGRGVAGVLEANFIEPTHNKQEFEKTTLFQKLEARLKDMTLEYWDFHCGLIGYKQEKNTSAERVPHSRARKGVQPVAINPGGLQPVTLNPGAPSLNSPRVPSAPTLNSPRVPSVGRPFDGTDFQSRSQEGRPGESVTNHQTSSVAGVGIKRKGMDHTSETERLKRRATAGENATNGSRHQGEAQLASGNRNKSQDREAKDLMQENKKLRAQCLQYEKSEEELNLKVERLKLELLEFQHEYARLMSESKSLEDSVKDEKT